MIEIENPNKPFWGLRASLAIQGAAIWRSESEDGARVYFFERNGSLRRFTSLDELGMHLDREVHMSNVGARAPGA